MENVLEYNVIFALSVNKVSHQIDDPKDYNKPFSMTIFITDIPWMNWLLNIIIQDNGSKRKYIPINLK